ncbi:Transcriptional regulatory protein DegU [Flagellimonas maritima]|uniref:Transcriptional regulatory protein DegU n=1 Tax=Flagellimonas maritima TaxID=1383885 RepID=A0A2Z4LT46_9FLAO|nr:LuxR C-terminal-related transcriptional regulator [Allomuricauda aurantiaca]AWX44899.1 Transcriptional regulatory protein DegU [Allomuricauda aurantiaca]
MKKTVFVFSALIVSLLALLQLSKYAYISNDISIEIIIAIIAICFFAIGLFINKRKSQEEKFSSSSIDLKKIEQLGISKREHEVLVQVSKGLSNKEIADQLFVSESTIKTHVSNLLVKLEAKRRTQAIQIAKKLQILSL